MRKFYYYTYKGGNFYGMGLVYSDGSCFPIYDITKSLREKNGVLTTVDFWKEISSEEYEKMEELLHEYDFEKKSNLF